MQINVFVSHGCRKDLSQIVSELSSVACSEMSRYLAGFAPHNVEHYRVEHHRSMDHKMVQHRKVQQNMVECHELKKLQGGPWPQPRTKHKRTQLEFQELENVRLEYNKVEDKPYQSTGEHNIVEYHQSLKNNMNHRAILLGNITLHGRTLH